MNRPTLTAAGFSAFTGVCCRRCWCASQFSAGIECPARIPARRRVFLRLTSFAFLASLASLSVVLLCAALVRRLQRVLLPVVVRRGRRVVRCVRFCSAHRLAYVTFLAMRPLLLLCVACRRSLCASAVRALWLLAFLGIFASLPGCMCCLYPISSVRFPCRSSSPLCLLGDPRFAAVVRRLPASPFGACFRFSGCSAFRGCVRFCCS